MTFKKYIETVSTFVEDKDRVYHALCLVSDTANLVEKIKYFEYEHSLVLAELGDAFFRTFAFMKSVGIELDSLPVKLEEYRLNVNDLETKFQITKENLIHSLVLEIGIMSTVVSTNMRYDISDYTENDTNRLRNSIAAYLLYLLILVCKYHFSIDKLLDFNISRHKALQKQLNIKEIND